MEKHYNPDYLADTGNFLKNLKESTYLPFSQVTDGTIIDLGCGTGMDAIKMCQMFGNSVRVVGIDHDLVMLNEGRSASLENLNVEFIHAEAFPIPFGDNSVAGVRAERLVQHLVQPQQVMDDIARVLSKDAPVVIVETDWPGLSLYNRHLSIEKKIVQYLTDVKVNNGAASRKITAYMRESGLRDIKVQVFPFILGTLEEANTYLWLDRIIQETADLGYINAQEHERFTDELKIADRDKYFRCSINMVVTSAVK